MRARKHFTQIRTHVRTDMYIYAKIKVHINPVVSLKRMTRRSLSASQNIDTPHTHTHTHTHKQTNRTHNKHSTCSPPRTPLRHSMRRYAHNERTRAQRLTHTRTCGGVCVCPCPCPCPCAPMCPCLRLNRCLCPCPCPCPGPGPCGGNHVHVPVSVWLFACGCNGVRVAGRDHN